MNRRSLLKAAAGAVAAACGLKVAEAKPLTEPVSVAFTWGQVTGVEYSPIGNGFGGPFYNAMFEKGRIDIDDIRRMELL